jgi:hypothetical protein
MYLGTLREASEAVGIGSDGTDVLDDCGYEYDGLAVDC